MIIKENLIFKMDSIRYRIVGFDNIKNNIFYINLDNKIKWAEVVNIYTLEKYINENIDEVEEDEFMYINSSEYKARDIEKRNLNYEIVSFLLKDNDIFYKDTRDKVIEKSMKIYKVSYSTVKRLLCNYLKSGKNLNSLIPKYNNCGAKGKERNIKNQKNAVVIDYEMKEVIRKGINKYYNTPKKNTIKICYELTMRDYLKINENAKIPTLNQYYYWFNKIIKNDNKNKLSRRYGERIYEQKTRALLSSSLEDGASPGEVYQLDSTIMDVYIVSQINRNLIVGRPVLYIVVDVYSRMIVGINVTIEPFNSYTGAMVALINAFSDKVEYCKKFGIDIKKEDWNIDCIPQRILSDRGELISSNVENAIANLGINIQNTASYRGDLKGIVEQLFNRVNDFIKPFCEGVVQNGINKIQRGAEDYRLKANLTLTEITAIVIKWVLFHNNNYIMKGYECDGITIKNDIPKIPNLIWNYGVKEKKGLMRKLNKEIVRMNLLPNKEAVVTEKGIRLNKLYYVSSETIKNGWFQKARVEGNYKAKVSYNPNDLSEIYYIKPSGLEYDTLSLISYQEQYKEIGEEELNIIFKQQKNIYEKYQEEELKAKMELYDEIEEITLNAKQCQEQMKDRSISKSQRLKGINDNLDKERAYHRNLDDKNDVEDIEELDIFESILNDEWSDDYE
ncbi:Mu transposase C-terminal domain-containing protein [Asaccharospora irregularis]|uniref:Mu transposase, C-terminal n=1 Tax=Asaccharospora irregularis DSM 2635 TaxID=1121321 RepID=A0A1M5RGP7_9FIRM|nr:Mu transposase C-terminal domain-containing protein [Asaccharospora irregularis]SHH25320.1 Mu transposase, C-terminal [Asaccharospora irregularis DSM 2635]